MMEAGLQQFRQIIMFGSTDETRDVGTSEGTGTGVQVVQKYPERVHVKLYDCKL